MMELLSCHFSTCCDKNLLALRTPALIVQGTRDSFGSFEELMEYNLSSSILASFMEDGDHSFKPRVRSGRTLEQNLNMAVIEISRFVQALEAEID